MRAKNQKGLTLLIQSVDKVADAKVICYFSFY